jgi:hypothetical protein
VQATSRVESTSEQAWQTKSKQQAAELTVQGQATRQYGRATSMIDIWQTNSKQKAELTVWKKGDKYGSRQAIKSKSMVDRARRMADKQQQATSRVDSMAEKRQIWQQARNSRVDSTAEQVV